MSLFSLSNKTTIITGAAKGIGKSIAQLFAKQGADVHILDIDLKAGEETAEEIRKNGYEAWFHRVDVSCLEEAMETFDLVFQKKKHLDILINNAGIGHVGNLEKTTEKDFDRVYSINVKGIYNCTQLAVKMMKINDGGVILNMASIVSIVGIPDRFAYSMSKGAVLAMTYSIAKDYIDKNIRCNAISPARVQTSFVDEYLKQNYPGKEKEMFDKLSKTQPIGRMGKPEEIAYLALYLCSDEAAFITGSNYPIDGGFIKLNN